MCRYGVRRARRGRQRAHSRFREDCACGPLIARRGCRQRQRKRQRERSCSSERSGPETPPATLRLAGEGAHRPGSFPNTLTLILLPPSALIALSFKLTSRAVATQPFSYSQDSRCTYWAFYNLNRLHILCRNSWCINYACNHEMGVYPWNEIDIIIVLCGGR